jgi:hypothetical protein
MSSNEDIELRSIKEGDLRRFIRIPFENGFSANNVVKIVEYEGNDPDECLKKGSRFEL